MNTLTLNELRELDLREALSLNDLASIGRPFRLDRSDDRLQELLSAPETANLAERGLVVLPEVKRSPAALSGSLTALPAPDRGLLAAWREVEEDRYREEEATERERLEAGFGMLTVMDLDDYSSAGEYCL